MAIPWWKQIVGMATSGLPGSNIINGLIDPLINGLNIGDGGGASIRQGGSAGAKTDPRQEVSDLLKNKANWNAADKLRYDHLLESNPSIFSGWETNTHKIIKAPQGSSNAGVRQGASASAMTDKSQHFTDNSDNRQWITNNPNPSSNVTPDVKKESPPTIPPTIPPTTLSGTNPLPATPFQPLTLGPNQTLTPASLPGLNWLPSILGTGLGALAGLVPEPQFDRIKRMNVWDEQGKGKFEGIWKDSITDPYHGDYFRNAQREMVTGTNAMIENSANKAEAQRLAGGALFAGGNQQALANAAPGFYQQTGQNLSRGYDIRNEAANFRNKFMTYNTDMDYQNWEADYAAGRLPEQNRGLALIAGKVLPNAVAGFGQGIDISSKLNDIAQKKAILERGLGTITETPTSKPQSEFGPFQNKYKFPNQGINFLQNMPGFNSMFNRDNYSGLNWSGYEPSVFNEDPAGKLKQPIFALDNAGNIQPPNYVMATPGMSDDGTIAKRKKIYSDLFPSGFLPF